MVNTMFKNESLYIEMFKRMEREKLFLTPFQLVNKFFLNRAILLNDEVYYGVLLFIGLSLLKRNFIVLDINEDIKKFNCNEKYEKDILDLKKCKHRCLGGIIYRYIMDEDYLFFLCLLDKIVDIKINIDETIDFMKGK